MRFRNATTLSDDRLLRMMAEHVDGWPHRSLDVSLQYSRGRDFSGLCDYRARRIRINIGRHVRFPYDIRTHIARARSNARVWWREIYTLRVADAEQLVFFVFLHEFYHWLVKQARRNTRQKEGMCDRFAARILVDRYGATVRDRHGRPVPREEWDFQDLEGFVSAARRKTRAATLLTRAARAPLPAAPPVRDGQLLLFPLDGPEDVAPLFPEEHAPPE